MVSSSPARDPMLTSASGAAWLGISEALASPFANGTQSLENLTIVGPALPLTSRGCAYRCTARPGRPDRSFSHPARRSQCRQSQRAEGWTPQETQRQEAEAGRAAVPRR
jgi:hypothetical protein